MSGKRAAGAALLLGMASFALHASTKGPAPPASHGVTLTGKVVDAACFMIHPPAANLPSHKDCGAACVARGVPLAIANDKDGALYFPADGNRQLLALLDQRVQATGTFVRNADVMELKMDVGQSNQMAVRVDGGYNVVTISTIKRASAR